MNISKERLTKIGKLGLEVGSLYFLYQIMVARFSTESLKIIYERDHDTCQECGASRKIYKLHGSHFNHNKSEPNYDDPDNGQLLCRPCHYLFHLEHQENPERIGLSRRHNNWAINALWDQLDLTEQRDVEDRMPTRVS